MRRLLTMSTTPYFSQNRSRYVHPNHWRITTVNVTGVWAGTNGVGHGCFLPELHACCPVLPCRL
jgi:hypothetical protein